MNVSELINHVEFSFIIPTFNRKNLVCNAINSALTFVGNDRRYEIIVIDDASTDGTFFHLGEKYFNEIENGLIIISKLSHNSGVVATRNQGAKLANGRWLLILDSDNEMIPGKKAEFESILFKTNSSFVLFRCVDDSGFLIGKDNMEKVMDYSSALNGDYPEFFGVCDRDSFLSEYTKADVVALKRFESIAYFRILKRNRSFYISNLVMRRYSFLASDRLSSKQGAIKDSNLLMLGHLILLKEHWHAMTIKRIFILLGAVSYYAWLHLMGLIGRIVLRRL
jgi:glycosyltransferase involved in cell wall biosynthesis